MEYADELLKDSDGYKKYTEFNNIDSPDGYENSFSEAFKIEPRNNTIKGICGKIAGILKEISHSTESKEKNEEICGYLHFWLYDNINRNFKDNDNVDIITQKIFLGAINFNSTLSNENCSIRFSPDDKLKNWVEGKLLYDYFKNFAYINNTHAFRDNKCEAYNNYISHINTLYKNCEDESYYSYDIRRHLLSYISDKYDPAKLISKLECENEKPAMDSDPHQSASLGETMEQAGSAPELLREEAQSGISSADSNSSSIVGSSVSLIGMFILFFSAYKFTPLGSWIYGKISKKEKIRNNIELLTNELLGNHSEYIDINDNNSTLHVAYSST
ncbi:PIR Superfamily Protein [Plasmodium ovale wallikeri]|uniref:PIR Superfamily Protein n=1 Tax=Plasmodium ovale wallikeri TaxID=864142 RepID=A0A1A9AS86_PLAOA|nr:PIR Superfamily Protein [Plasmodium ovale wallikeri]SBT59088.1 PIR Superfamily Protein [Plasmodium ovale wallikeri]